MPEFTMEGRDHAARAESEFVLGFLEAIFFTETGSINIADFFTEESQIAIREGQDLPLPVDSGYCDLHPDSLAAIRKFCNEKQTAMQALLDRAYLLNCKAAAVAEGWTRVFPSGLFNAPLGHETRLADYESWQELCECEGIATGKPYDERQAGIDLFMTYQGHGVGFWDREVLKHDGVGADLTDICGRGDIHVWFGDHVKTGNAPFVYVEIS